MSELSIVLVSDIHAGPDSSYDELRVPPTAARPTPRTRFHTIPALGDAIVSVLGATPVEKRVLICTGDLSSSCHSEEIAATGAALTSLADKLNIPNTARFVLPGNHDIDWPLTEMSQKDAWYDRYRQEKIRDVLNISAPTFLCPTNGVPVQAQLSSGALLYLLDSAHEDRHNTHPHRGRIGEPQRLALQGMLSAASPDALKIVALHHHVHAFSPTNGSPDLSQLEDASDLLSLLYRHSVPILLHGHQHYPFITKLQGGSVPITVVSSGSTTAPTNKLPEQVPNTFHVVSFDDLHATAPKGEVQTRMFTGPNGWQHPLLSLHHVASRKPFGVAANTLQLEQWADEAISVCETEKLVYLDYFLLDKPDGKYLCHHDFGDAVARRLAATNASDRMKLVNAADNDQVILQMTPTRRVKV